MACILLVEDRESLRQVYAAFLRQQHHEVVEAGSVEEALVSLEQAQYALVITDYMLPGANGLDFLKALIQRDPDFTVIIMTAFGEVKLAVEAMRNGAFDFLEKPIDLGYLKMVVTRALEHHELKRRQSFSASRERGQQVAIVGDSALLAASVSLAAKVAPTPANCLLLGESGVGKELFAQKIHKESQRSDGPMISINCASIPADLMESELFGHEKGAFTGAVARKVGLVEMADGGSLFLDEIGELPLALQPKLLRVIQTREFFRLGGSRLFRSDIRLICATNRNLKQGIREGWFREDLYFRLAVFPIEIPPLRDRSRDLEALVPWFLKRLGHPHLEPDAVLFTALKQYSWPGNVRELENVLERAVILSQGQPLTREHFPGDLFASSEEVTTSVSLNLNVDFKENLKRLEPTLERRLIQCLLQVEGGNREKVAARLEITPKTLYNRMKRLQIEYPPSAPA